MPPGQIRQHPSPNHGPRRDGLRPELIVIHYTAMPSAEAALARLCDPVAEVSAHYLICRKGAITQLVEEDRRAWHAGAGSWRGQDDINSRSIGIELDNAGNHPFSEPQMRALEDLIRGIMARWSMSPNGVIGHSDMAPGRKSDPGPHFDWARLARGGLAVTTPCRPAQTGDMNAFRTAATAAGYPGDVSDEALLHAVRLRHAPWRSGALSPEDFALLPLQTG